MTPSNRHEVTKQARGQDRRRWPTAPSPARILEIWLARLLLRLPRQQMEQYSGRPLQSTRGRPLGCTCGSSDSQPHRGDRASPETPPPPPIPIFPLPGGPILVCALPGGAVVCLVCRAAAPSWRRGGLAPFTYGACAAPPAHLACLGGRRPVPGSFGGTGACGSDGGGMRGASDGGIRGLRRRAPGTRTAPALRKLACSCCVAAATSPVFGVTGSLA